MPYLFDDVFITHEPVTDVRKHNVVLANEYFDKGDYESVIKMVDDIFGYDRPLPVSLDLKSQALYCLSCL